MLNILTTIYAILFGLCFGSFANVIIYRLPRNESIAAPPSHCPSCDVRLAACDLIPVLSWLLLRGHCRRCGARISVRYPAVEVLCAALFACMALYTGPNLSVIPLCVLAFVLLCTSCVDIDIQEIPDGLLIFGVVAGIIWIAADNFLPLEFVTGAPEWQNALLGALAGALPIFLIDRLVILLTGKDGFGFGDVKLMAMSGLFLGWEMALWAQFFAVVAGGAYAAVLLFTRRARRGDYLAFGPFLAVGVLTALWFGSSFAALLFPGA